MLIKVMADYECGPLWWDGEPDRIGNIQPEALGLSDGLCADLSAWAKIYDGTLVSDDPVSSGFPSLADERAFEEQGRRLAARVADELGNVAMVRPCASYRASRAGNSIPRQSKFFSPHGKMAGSGIACGRGSSWRRWDYLSPSLACAAHSRKKTTADVGSFGGAVCCVSPT